MSRRLKLKVLYYCGVLMCFGIGWWIAELSQR